MIVDDERNNLQSLFELRFRRQVREALHLHFAFSGEEALASLKHRGIADIGPILSDINVPA